MAVKSPFGQETRVRILKEYFADAGEVTADNAWEHVYRCLLWMNQSAGLAHVYDSNHMQRGGVFHSRAVRFSELLCEHWGITLSELPGKIDILFRGCVAELEKQRPSVLDSAQTEETNESDLVAEIEAILERETFSADRLPLVAREIEAISRDYFTIGKKRMNALGEGVEDLMLLLLERVSRIPKSKLFLRKAVSELPGFRRAPPRKKGERLQRQPKPDIAIVEGNVTHVITTAKWSLRQDRETQFQSEYSSYQMNKVQSTELRYALITNEFDIARLRNVLQAIPGGEGGYIFHNVYHVCLPLVEAIQGPQRFSEIEPWVRTGKLRSLSDFFEDIAGRYGEAE